MSMRKVFKVLFEQLFEICFHRFVRGNFDMQFLLATAVFAVDSKVSNELENNFVQLTVTWKKLYCWGKKMYTNKYCFFFFSEIHNKDSIEYASYL